MANLERSGDTKERVFERTGKYAGMRSESPLSVT